MCPIPFASNNEENLISLSSGFFAFSKTESLWTPSALPLLQPPFAQGRRVTTAAPRRKVGGQRGGERQAQTPLQTGGGDAATRRHLNFVLN